MGSQPQRVSALLRADEVKRAAREAGFAEVGLARPEPIPGDALRGWLARGNHGEMRWLARSAQARLDPRRVLAGCRTVIALGICHATSEHQLPSPFASFARTRDYHATFRDRFRRLRRALRAIAPHIDDYACCDSGLVMEKVWAARAGLGWQGKQTLLISPKHGAKLLLGAMLIDREVDHYDEPIPSRCGDCRRCVEACPTSALDGASLDARRCLAYWTIEAVHEVMPEDLRPHLSSVYGCDLCQRACPHNLPEHHCDDPRFAVRPFAHATLEELAISDEDSFAQSASGMSVARAGWEAVRRNARFMLANRDGDGEPANPKP